MLEKVQEFVRESFGEDNPHLNRTLYWIRQLDPAAPEELLIAAVSHDIERAFNPDARKTDAFRTGEAQKQHQREGGRIMQEFLMKQRYAPAKAERVCELIAAHEDGGDAEQNLLRDADSLSWLEVSAPKHICKRKFPRAELETKVGYMYRRISSPRARELARPFFEKAVELLVAWAQ